MIFGVFPLISPQIRRCPCNFKSEKRHARHLEKLLRNPVRNKAVSGDTKCEVLKMQELGNEEYAKLVKRLAPASPVVKDCAKAFVSGGLICALGQALLEFWKAVGLADKDAATAVSVTLIFAGAFLTGIGVFDRIAKHAGAGTLVPITGFANSVAAPALEFKTEGFVAGTAVKMFTIAGPVIVFGVAASVVYGIVLVIIGAI